jgi:hypothetical protein
VFAVGAAGSIRHFDGSTWAAMLSGTTITLNAVWGHRDAGVFVVGSGGTILRRPRSCASTETACSDRVENDCDGLIDCADPDCTNDAFCTAGGLCPAAPMLACGTGLSTTTSGGRTLLERYACDGSLRPGLEKSYRVSRATTGTVTVELSGLNRDADVIVLRADASGTCNPRNPGCVGVSASTGTTNEQVSFTANAGEIYHVVVDTYDARAASYSLLVNCP